MSKTMSRGPTRNKNYLGLMSIFFTLLISAMFFYPQSAKAVGTPATTVITNQASADYNDGVNNYTSFSGSVNTTVQAVYGILVTPDGTADGTGVTTLKQNAVPGTLVYYQYTVKNTGNAPDDYKFDVAEDLSKTFSATSIKVYWNKSGNIALQSGDPQLTPLGFGGAASAITAIPADGTEKVVVVVEVPSTATSGQFDPVNLLGQSVGDTTQNDTNNFNRTTVTTDSVITVTKSMSVSTASPGDTITYTLDVKNTGLAPATAIDITDAIPANTAFVSASQVIPVTIPASTISYSTDGTTFSGTAPAISPAASGVIDTVRKVKFTIGGSLAANNNVILKFNVKIAPYISGGTPAPNTNIDNTASFVYTNSALTVTGPLNSNTVTTTVNKKSAVKITPNTTPFTTQTVEPTGSDIGLFPTLPTDKVTTAASAPGVASAGSSVYFREVVTNNGNATDSFTLSLDPSISLPANWAVTFLQETDATVGANNTSALTSNSTGPLAPGASINVVVRVYIPAAPGTLAQDVRIATTSTNGGTNYLVDYPNRTIDYTLDSIPAISLPSVQLSNVTNNLVTPLVTTAISYTESANGATVSFPLNVKNTGGTNDTFNLSATTPGFGVVFYPINKSTTVATAALANDTSITVVNATGIVAGDTIAVGGQTLTVGSVAGNVITFTSGQKLTNAVPLATDLVSINNTAIVNTSPLAPNASQNVLAVVSVPNNTLANTYTAINFTATSNLNSVGVATVPDTIVVPPFKTFTLVGDRTGNSPAGGTIMYTHILTNTGNITETFSLSNNSGSFTYVFLDSSATPAVLTPLTGITLVPGASLTFKIRVSVPANSAPNTIDSVNVVATESTAGFLSNNDKTTVVSGFVILDKTGRTIDKNSVTPIGAGLPASGGTTKVGTSGANYAVPGDIIEYTITYINNAATSAQKTVITDNIPANTTYVTGSLKINGVAKTDALTDDTADSLTTEAGNTANPAPRGSVVFRVGTTASSTLGGTLAQGDPMGSVTFRVIVN